MRVVPPQHGLPIPLRFNGGFSVALHHFAEQPLRVRVGAAGHPGRRVPATAQEEYAECCP